MTNGYKLIELQSLFALAKQDEPGNGLSSDDEIGRKFSREAGRLAQDIPTTSGFYFWINSKKKEIIYIGQSHNLKRRILEGLRNERILFWHKTHLNNYQEYKDDLQERNPRKFTQYINYWERYIEKRDAEEIIIIPTPDLSHIRLELIESSLINELKPKANTQNLDEHQLINLPNTSRKTIEDLRELIYSRVLSALVETQRDR